VGEQRLDDVAIVAALSARAFRELAHERRTALAARALEAALAAERGVGEAARGTRRRERTGITARYAREADLCAEVEERLVPLPCAAGRRRHVGGAERSLEHPPDVRVEGRDVG